MRLAFSSECSFVKLFSIALISVGFTLSLPCRAATACAGLTVEASAAVQAGNLTLADLLASNVCAAWRQEAKLVSLGAAPQPGKVRVLQGREIRPLLEALEKPRIGGTMLVKVPEKIVITRAGVMMSCAEFAGIVADSVLPQSLVADSGHWKQTLDCAGAPRIAEQTPLELRETSWNAALQRWEFALRCARVEDCVPFLLWVRAPKGPEIPLRQPHQGFAAIEDRHSLRVVAPGQTAILTWDQGGIRVVLPVTCLEAGAPGESVRVRFPNTLRTLRAQVTGDGTLRASL